MRIKTGERIEAIFDKVCDVCGISVYDSKENQFEFSLNYRTGHSYGNDGGSGTQLSLDLCADHSKEFIETVKLNYKVAETEWDC